jgi:16S rRNA (cytosine967-C5)-methyltransferase
VTDPSGSAARRQAVLLRMGKDDDLGQSGPDRAFAHRMYREAVVWRSRLDHSLAAASDRGLGSLDGEMLACLRIGAVQLLVLGVRPHAAVSATVAVLRDRRRRGYANAVLRRLASGGEAGGAPAHVRWSHPPGLASRWADRYGDEAAAALMEWNNSVPGLGVWTLPGSGPPRGEPGRWAESWTAIPREDLADVLTSGLHFVQDEAAALVGSSVASMPGRTVLETGCAPGGKTVHIQGPGRFTVAVDSSCRRLAKWAENSVRYGFSGCSPAAAEGERLPFRDNSFDLVLLDAPCTGTGVYRRRFDARWNWSPGLLAGCTETQRRLLDGAAAAVRPGGCLVYSTCSLEPEENGCQVEAFEERHPEFGRMAFPAPAQLVTEGLLSIFPPEHGMDGMFAAAWKRTE